MVISFSPLRFQSAKKPVVLPLPVEFKFRRVPVAVEGGCDLVQSSGQVLRRDLHVPFQTAGHGHLGQVGGAHIGGGKAGVAVKHIGLGMETGAVGVVADLDLGVGQPVQLLDGLGVGGAHVGGGDHPQLAAVLGKGAKFFQDQPQTAPLDEGNQHVDPVGAGNFLFQFGKHLGLVQRAGEQTAAGQRRPGPGQVARRAVHHQQRVVFPQKRKKLLRPAVNAQRGKVSFLGRVFDGLDQPVDQPDLGSHVAALVRQVVQPLLGHFSQVLRQHLGGLRLVDGRRGAALRRERIQFAADLLVDDLLIKAGL